MSQDHIPTEEIIQDIKDTEKEIYQLQRSIDSKRESIRERQAFIDKLRIILDERDTSASRKDVDV